MSELFPIEETLSPRLKWMKEHGVLTHHAPHCDEAPWLAIQKMPGHSGTVGKIMEEYCRLYEDHGYCGYGLTEEAALADLSRNRKIKLWNE